MKLLLIHNSDHLQMILRLKDQSRPLFYWYTDRFASHIGTHKYLYICIVDTDKHKLEYRHTNPTFDDVHKQFLAFKDFKENNTANVKYAEPGILMSYDEIKPSIILKACNDDPSVPTHLQTDFEIISPRKAFKRQIVRLISEPYDDLYADKPVQFADIPELVKIEPRLKECYPVVTY